MGCLVTGRVRFGSCRLKHGQGCSKVMPARRRQMKKLGQAAVMTLSHVLCARITEALSLRASDFYWRGKCVIICALKGQPQAGCTCS